METENMEPKAKKTCDTVRGPVDTFVCFEMKPVSKHINTCKQMIYMAQIEPFPPPIAKNCDNITINDNFK